MPTKLNDIEDIQSLVDGSQNFVLHEVEHIFKLPRCHNKYNKVVHYPSCCPSQLSCQRFSRWATNAIYINVRIINNKIFVVQHYKGLEGEIETNKAACR